MNPTRISVYVTPENEPAARESIEAALHRDNVEYVELTVEPARADDGTLANLAGSLGSAYEDA